jgi:hypothetical protein
MSMCTLGKSEKIRSYEYYSRHIYYHGKMYEKIKREIEYSGSQITKHEKRFIYVLLMVLQLEKYLYTRFFCQKTRTYITLHKIISETIVDRRT